MLKTHKMASKNLVGEVVELKENESVVRLKTTKEMVVDEKGLIHGGFTFGLADLAAMVAVNHPNVVLGKAEVRFTNPVKVGDEVFAYAKVVKDEGRKRLFTLSRELMIKSFWKGTFTATFWTSTF